MKLSLLRPYLIHFDTYNAENYRKMKPKINNCV